MSTRTYAARLAAVIFAIMALLQLGRAVAGLPASRQHEHTGVAELDR
jgi:hypothetical protein